MPHNFLKPLPNRPAAWLWRSPNVTQPYRGTLIPGPGVSVFVGRSRERHRRPHTHKALQLMFVLNGASCTVGCAPELGTELRHTLTKDDVWIVPAGVRHVEQWSQEPLMLILYVNSRWLEWMCPETTFVPEVVPIQDLAFQDHLISGMIAAFQPHTESSAGNLSFYAGSLGQCLASRVIQRLTTLQVGALKNSRKLKSETMERVETYIRQNLGQKIRLADMAWAAGLSPGYFSQVFKQTCGMTPEQYLLRQRLNRAMELLQAGEFRVGQVAYLTGFSDHSHLTVQFKKVFGVTPKSVRPPVRTV